MIKYSTLVGEYYDINLQSKEDAIVILNYLDINDYIEVENIFGQKENIEVGSIVKVSMNNKQNDKKQTKKKIHRILDEMPPYDGTEDNHLPNEYTIVDREGNVIDTGKHPELSVMPDEYSSNEISEEDAIRMFKEYPLNDPNDVPTGYIIVDSKGNKYDPKKFPELAVLIDDLNGTSSKKSENSLEKQKDDDIFRSLDEMKKAFEDDLNPKDK